MEVEEGGSRWVVVEAEEGDLFVEAEVVVVFPGGLSMDSFPFISYSPISSHSQRVLISPQLIIPSFYLEYPLVPPIPECN